MDIRKLLQPIPNQTGNSPRESGPVTSAAETCSRCHDTGWVRYDYDLDWSHPDFGKLTRCPCRTQRDAEDTQSRLGSPIDQDITLGVLQDRGLDSRRMIAASKAFIDHPVTFLTFWGVNGTGKSTALQGIANHFIAGGLQALYITASDAASYIKAGIGKDFNPDDRVAWLSTIPVLCLDEITQAYMGDWIKDHFGSIVDRRYKGHLGTVLAMDEDPAEKLPRRILSRMMTGPVIQIDESDMRPLLGGNG